MVRSLARIALVAVLSQGLAGCFTGSPFAHGPDDQLAETTAQSGPLADQCTHYFLTDLHGQQVSLRTGPSITRSGNLILVDLEAQPQDPYALHARRYSCTFQNGALTSKGPVE